MSKELIETIEKALESSTTWPWTWKPGDKEYDDLGAIVGPGGQNVCWFGNYTTYYPTEGEEPSNEDINVMVNAPTWLRELIEELKYAHKMYDQVFESRANVETELKKVREERDKLLEVVKWYADEETYTVLHLGCSPMVMADRGTTARTILTQLEEYK